MDYGNGTLANLPYSTIKPLQRVQNRAAKLILKREPRASSTLARKELHWLPIPERIQFKTLCMSYNCVQGVAPEYLCNVFTKSEPKAYRLRSMNTTMYNVPKTRCKTYGDRAFGVNGPKQWNSLPTYLKDIDNYSVFKKALKTYFFNKVYF